MGILNTYPGDDLYGAILLNSRPANSWGSFTPQQYPDNLVKILIKLYIYG